MIKKSPFANYVGAYSFIIVEANNIGYSYKVQALDENGYGTYLIKPEEIIIEELDTRQLSHITKQEDTYVMEFKNYSISKTPYIFTCEALNNDTELPSPPDEEETPPKDEQQPPEDEQNPAIPNGKTTLRETLLTDNVAQADTSINFTNPSSDTNGKGLYYTSTNTEGNKPTYYFRGAVTNNIVKFGKYETEKSVYRGYSSSGSSSFEEYSTLEECNSATSNNVDCTKYTYANKGDDMYWKIVRINEDGSIRLIYNGTSPTATNGYATIGMTTFASNGNYPTGAGYMHSSFSIHASSSFGSYKCYAKSGYGNNVADLTSTYSTQSACEAAGGAWVNSAYEAVHANIVDSEIKTYIDDWYEANLKTNYSSYLADAGFCNDRSIAPSAGLWASDDTALGYGTNTTYYGAYSRVSNIVSGAAGLLTNKKPQFKCVNETRDLFTTGTATKGNNKLGNPIGLITADELEYAGRSTTDFLNIGEYFWTMSPFRHKDTGMPQMFLKSKTPGITGQDVTGSRYYYKP